MQNTLCISAFTQAWEICDYRYFAFLIQFLAEVDTNPYINCCEEFKKYFVSVITFGNESPKSRLPKENAKKSRLLIFRSGETNPYVFLNEFENCDDTKTDLDKTWNILRCHLVRNRNVFRFFRNCSLELFEI